MKYIVFIALASALLLAGCNEKKEAGSDTLDVNAFEEKMNQTSDKTLLDVRTAPEYDAGHLANSVLVDFQSQDFPEKIDQLRLDKSKPVFVYCAAGSRSQKAAAVLKEKGFTEVYHMEGGINKWAEANKPVVKD